MRHCYHWLRRSALDVFVVAVTLGTVPIAYAQSTEAPAAESAESAATALGRLDFDAAHLPEANLEVNLSQDMFRDLFGIGDAAVSGVIEALSKSDTPGDSGKATKIAAEQMEAARQILQLAGAVVREVRVIAYEDFPEEAGDPQKLFQQFDAQLSAGKWETLVRARKDDEMARVSAVRSGGAVRGIFVVATDGDGVVLANVVCDVTPENAKKLTAAATKIGLENGLAKDLQRKFGQTVVIQAVEPGTPALPATPPSPPPVPVVK